MKIAVLFALLVPLAGCVGHQLRHAASVGAVEVQDFDTGIAYFDATHRAAINRADASAARLLAVADATDAAVEARILTLKGRGDVEQLRVMDAASPTLLVEPQVAATIKSPTYNGADQQALLDALNKTAKKPTAGENAELLLGFAVDIATKMKSDVDDAAKAIPNPTSTPTP
jgi:hypothetical protein